jgi:type IV secretory pathway VirB4 component
MLLDELRRILLIPGATEFVKELLAQMRKYRCVFIGAFQEPSQIDDIDPALTDLLLGQCKQYFLMRQNNADQVAGSRA